MPGIAGWVPLSGSPNRKPDPELLSEMLTHEPGDSVRHADLRGGGTAVIARTHIGQSGAGMATATELPVQLLFSGELYDSGMGRLDGDAVARRLLDRYLEVGSRFVDDLDGSFVLFVSDGRSGRVLLATDFSGSRPMFYCHSPEALAFAPELRAVTGLSGRQLSIDEEAPVTFLLHGHLLNEQTWFAGVKPLLAGSVLQAGSAGELEIRRYFQLGPLASGPRVDGSTGDSRRLADLLRAAVAKRVKDPSGLILPLSGGVDSRGILGCLLESGVSPIRTVSWGVSESAEGADAAVARELAESYGTDHTFLQRTSERLPDDIGEMIARTSALTDDPALHHHELTLMRRIRDQLGGRSLLRGDECFGFGGMASSDAEAFARVSITQLAYHTDVQGLLRADEVDGWIGRSRHMLEQISASTDLVDYTDRKDSYYASQRLFHYLNRSSYYKLTVLDLQNPWLDRDVLEYVSRCETACRIEKKLFVSTLHEMFPRLMQLPFAARHSLEDWTSVIRTSPAVNDFVRDWVIDQADGFDRWLDPQGVVKFATSAIVASGRAERAPNELVKVLARRLLPAPLRRRLKARFVDQALRTNFSPGILLLRLLILRLWIEQIDSFRSIRMIPDRT